MSIPTLMSALGQGFNAKQILDWLINNHKKLAKHIKSAKTQGYNDDQILSYLTKGKHASHGQRNEMLSGMTEQEKGSRITNAGTDVSGIAKGLGTAASIAASAYGLGKGVPAIVQGARRLFGGGGGIGPQPMGGAPVQPQMPQVGQTINIPLAAQAAAPATAPNAPQSPIAGQAVPLQQPLSPQAIQRKQMLQHPAISDPEFKAYAQDQLGRGENKTYEELYEDYKKFKKKSPFMHGIEGDVAKMQSKETDISKMSTTEIQRLHKVGYAEALRLKEAAKPTKGDLVGLPSGIAGSLESIRDKEALVKDENGKLHKVKADEIVSSPLPEKDIAELHDELLRGIEKTTGQQPSRNVQWSGYSPEENLLAYIPHDGGLYIYDDISPEDAKELTSLMHQRKTTGENFIGAWEAGTESPIGAAMSKLIQRLQSERGGKGKEYAHKFPTIYHYLEPAIKLAKFKKRKRK